MNSEILVEIKRGDTVESIHRGHLFIVDGDGKEIARLGNPEIVTFFRSAAKPFQSIPFLMSGAAERFGFSEKEVAISCGSHSGEAIHTETSAKMLARCGLSESDLRCGAHEPFNETITREMIRSGEKPNQLHNNCSGKHAAMLAFAKQINAPIETYNQIEHPIQQAILQMTSDFADIPKEEIPLGIDGCAAPNFALPILAMARMFAKLVLPPKTFSDDLREACRRIVSAMMSYPEMIGGDATERLDTEIMRILRGKIISKIGAEGVYLAGVLPSPTWKRGLGIAFKIEDGEDKRARPVVAVEVLRQLGILDEKSLERLKKVSRPEIFNRRGDVVGEVVAKFKLNLL